jgi:alkylated DNA repair dioxygenase AlkB
MIAGVTFVKAFIERPSELYVHLEHSVKWDERMAARKTASFGKAYNYSQIEYPFQPFLPKLELVKEKVAGNVGFVPNNCLINYYPDGKSRMGFHSDQTDILESGTGIAIVSLGQTRALIFRNIADPLKAESFELPSGSLIYMTQEVQSLWQHAIPQVDTQRGRMSLTFRLLK